MNKMLEIFKNDIFTNTSGRVKDVKIIPRINGLIASQNANEEQGDPTSSPTGGQVTVAQRQHVWVSTMDEFRKSMVSVHKTLKGLQMNMESYRIKVSREYPLIAWVKRKPDSRGRCSSYKQRLPRSLKKLFSLDLHFFSFVSTISFFLSPISPFLLFVFLLTFFFTLLVFFFWIWVSYLARTCLSS
jgi:hypothetical protein